jgi:hypothetical protein
MHWGSNLEEGFGQPEYVGMPQVQNADIAMKYVHFEKNMTMKDIVAYTNKQE